MTHPLHDIIVAQVETDIAQMTEEGHDPETLSAELLAAVATGSMDAVLTLQDELWHRPSPADFPYEEPSDWEAIASQFPDPASSTPFTGSADDLRDRLLAAWQGRCAGCQLGKPLEGVARPEKLKAVLQAVDSWPLTDYMNPVTEDVPVENLAGCGEFFEKDNRWRNALTCGSIQFVAPDDDIHYAVAGLVLLEKHGVEFTPKQAVENYPNLLPLGCFWAAGRSGYRTSIFGVEPPFTAALGNPARQSLGAQIRCDPFGWAAPGNPHLAAHMAWKDAVWSQTRNGIYSGIFFAVMMADVMAHGDIPRAIATATSFVPPKSRFAEMIALITTACDECADWEAANARIYAQYPEECQRFNHAIPNAAIVLLGLLMGEGDFTKTLGITVMAGLDTDCTGATVGSIMGCALGAGGIPAHWTAPLNDSIHTSMLGMTELKISEVAERTFAVANLNTERGA
jgi:ADP-ribosylglycohydrolase